MKETDVLGRETSYEYDAVGNQTHIRYPNGLTSVSTFDSLNRVTSITTLDADDNVLTRYAYDLDETGRRTRLTEHSGRVSDYVYDDLYRLIQESITDPVNGDNLSTYTYGKTGNRTQSVINGITTEYAYDANDRLLSQGAFTYSYDAQGNMLSETEGSGDSALIKTYQYDANQRMKRFSDGVQAITYEYNPDGIRTSKRIGGSSIDFIVDSNRDYAQVIAEQVNNVDINKEYVFGYDLLSQIELGSVDGEDTSETAFYHYDGLGSTRALSNTQSTITDEYFYEAFGALLASTGDTANDYQFTGEQYDAQLDNYYLRARYYNQGTGRFTQQDTWMGNANSPITLNKYLYGNGDPANFTDPTGNFSITELQTVNNIRTNLSSLQIDVGVSLLDAYFDPENAATNAGNNAIALGLGVIGGPSSFKVLRMLSSKFRKACNSFTGDTLVATEFGLRAIKDIKIGDKVWAYNEQTGEKTLQPVIHLINGEGEKEIVDIELLSGELVQATGNHPFYANINEEWLWVDANELTPSHILYSLNGENVAITSLDKYWQQQSVFNLTVANDHTYFVGEDEVLAHNSGVCKPLLFSNKSISHLFSGNKTGGFHSRPLGVNPSTANVINIKRKIMIGRWKGAYSASVRICPAGGKCFKKTSSFFPDSWSRSRIKAEINTAYLDALSKGKSNGLILGRSSTGGQIEMVVKPNGELVTAYPKFR